MFACLAPMPEHRDSNCHNQKNNSDNAKGVLLSEA